MNRFIMANSQQCLGCHACEIACVMAHNDEQHVLSQHHFHPRITVIKHQQQRSAVTCHHCEDAPCAVVALMAQSATLMTAFRSISKSVLAVNPAWWPVHLVRCKSS